MECIEKFIHIINSGRFYQHPVIPGHAHRNQLRFKPSSVTIAVTPAGNHFQITLVS